MHFGLPQPPKVKEQEGLEWILLLLKLRNNIASRDRPTTAFFDEYVDGFQ
jgi:hypothetical protein